MYAIFRSGGRQYHAEIGTELNLERLPNEVGDKIEFTEVLLVKNGGQAQIGTPLVTGATVNATVIEQFRGKKIIVWKYRPRKRYRRKQGHRQYYTRLRIDDIVPAKGKAAESKAEAPAKAVEKTQPGEAPAQPSTRKGLAGLGVPERTATALADGDIKTVGAFIKVLEEGGDAALLAIKGIGPKGLEDVKQLLRDEGYTLPE